jgi:cyanophycinase
MRSLIVLLVLALVGVCASAQAEHPYQYFRVGAKNDIHVHPRAGYALMGGGTDQPVAFRWLCSRADGGDLLVLRASGTDDYDPWIQNLCRLNSVAMLIIPSRAAATDPFVASTITDAAAIFISGGDQSKYVRFWSGTPVEAALRQAVRRGIPMGGTSAGLAVLGQYIYSAENDSPDGPNLTSAAALANPFARQVVIAPDLVGIPILRGVITDTHFDKRHREGRLLVFMARILASSHARRIRAIGVDQETAVRVNPNGEGKVVGRAGADFYEASAKPQCRPNQPLTFGPVREWIVTSGQSFNLATWRDSNAPSLVAVRNGKIIRKAAH